MSWHVAIALKLVFAVLESCLYSGLYFSTNAQSSGQPPPEVKQSIQNSIRPGRESVENLDELDMSANQLGSTTVYPLCRY